MEIEKLVFHNWIFPVVRLLLEHEVSLLMPLDNTVKIICLIPIKISWLLVLKAMQMCKPIKSTICVCKLWLLGQSSKMKTLTVLIMFVILRRPDGCCAAAACPAASETQASPSSAAAESDPAAGRTGPGRCAAKGICCLLSLWVMWCFCGWKASVLNYEDSPTESAGFSGGGP